VDDDDTYRELVEAALGDEGYEVSGVANGVAALEIVGRYKPHLILIDLRMPVQDGPEFAKAYRRRRGPRAPLALITAARDPEVAAAGMGAAACLAKPFDLAQLINLVARLAGS
jgi:CheY-like chemotaxis protein